MSDHLQVPQKIRAVDRLRRLLTSRDPEIQAAVHEKNLSFLNMKMLTPGAVHVDAALANMSVQYRNEEYIGLNVMPLVTVSKLSNKYFIYGKRDRIAVPDDNVGTRSIPNEIVETRSTDNYSCQPKALMDFVDDLTLQNEDAPLNEMIDLVAAVNDGIDLAEELRIATVMQATGSYASGYSSSIGAANRWDSASGGDPVANIQDAVALLRQGPGATKKVGWCGADVWKVLSRHPKILDVSKYTRQGFMKTQQFADFFELDEFHVGRSWKDGANPGSAQSLTRIWGNTFGVCRVAQNPGIRSLSFGYTFRFGQKLTTQWYEPKPGMSGGYYAKVGLAEDHKIVGNDAGYLYATAIG